MLDLKNKSVRELEEMLRAHTKPNARKNINKELAKHDAIKNRRDKAVLCITILIFMLTLYQVFLDPPAPFRVQGDLTPNEHNNPVKDKGNNNVLSKVVKDKVGKRVACVQCHTPTK